MQVSGFNHQSEKTKLLSLPSLKINHVHDICLIESTTSKILAIFLFKRMWLRSNQIYHVVLSLLTKLNVAFSFLFSRTQRVEQKKIINQFNSSSYFIPIWIHLANMSLAVSISLKQKTQLCWCTSGKTSSSQKFNSS
jgi:hypothetical protein